MSWELQQLTMTGPIVIVGSVLASKAYNDDSLITYLYKYILLLNDFYI